MLQTPGKQGPGTNNRARQSAYHSIHLDVEHRPPRLIRHAMPTDTLKYLHQLQALKAELLTAGDNPIEPAQKDEVGAVRPDEDAQPLAEMNQVIASSRNRARTDVLQRVLAALARLEQDPDSFGLCTDCGDQIAARRLTLMPYVELCVECQQAHDRPSGPSGRRNLRDFR